METLKKQAIDAALKNNWEKAAELNLQILEKAPKDLEAKIRLGRAYIQTANFSKAIKIFEEVLKADPINPIAKKNIKIARERRIDKGTNGNLTAKALVKEPGTTVEARFEITNRKLKMENFTSGDELKLKIKKSEVDVYGEGKFIGKITDRNLVKELNIAKSGNSELNTNYIKTNNGKAIALIKCNYSVFRSEKQDVKPYFKKGTIDEPELEFSIEEEEVTEE